METRSPNEAGRRRPIEKRRGKRGVVTVEYAFLLVVFAVPTIAALTAAGVSVVNTYTSTRNNVLHVGP